MRLLYTIIEGQLAQDHYSKEFPHPQMLPIPDCCQ
jgi:hypothetical protein